MLKSVKSQANRKEWVILQNTKGTGRGWGKIIQDPGGGRKVKLGEEDRYFLYTNFYYIEKYLGTQRTEGFINYGNRLSCSASLAQA